MTTSHENLLGSFVTRFDHGLLVVEDSESRASHDGWDASTEYVHVDEESLYVAVQSIVDGPVEVAVYRRDAPKDVVEGLVQAFSGVFGSRSGKIRIQDSDGKAVLTFGRRGEGGLVVLVDELNWAARVVLVVG